MVQVRLVNTNGSLSEDVTVMSPAVTETVKTKPDTVVITGTIQDPIDGVQCAVSLCALIEHTLLCIALPCLHAVSLHVTCKLARARLHCMLTPRNPIGFVPALQLTQPTSSRCAALTAMLATFLWFLPHACHATL